MLNLNSVILIIALHINGLNIQMKSRDCHIKVIFYYMLSKRHPILNVKSQIGLEMVKDIL